MPSIGGTSCTYVKRINFADTKQHITVFTVPGLDGIGAHKLGRHDSGFRFLAVLYDTSANAETWRATLEAMQGEVITIIDDWSVTHTNCLAVKVHDCKKTPAGYSPNCKMTIAIEGVFTQ